MENNFVQTERQTDRQTFLNLFKFKKKVPDSFSCILY